MILNDQERSQGVLGEVNDAFENSVHEIVEESETDAVDLRRLEEAMW